MYLLNVFFVLVNLFGGGVVVGELLIFCWILLLLILLLLLFWLFVWLLLKFVWLFLLVFDVGFIVMGFFCFVYDGISGFLLFGFVDDVDVFILFSFF